MLGANWTVSARIMFGGNGPEYLERLSKQIDRMSEQIDFLAKSTRSASATMTRFAARTEATLGPLARQGMLLKENAVAMERFAIASRNARVSSAGGYGGGRGHGGIGVGDIAGLAAGATLIGGVRSAADMQSSIATLAVQLGSSSDQIRRQFLPLAMSISDKTARSVPDTLKLVSTLSTFIKSPATLSRVAPTIAQLADVLYLGPRQLDFNETGAEFGRMAHQLNIYRDPKQLQGAADLFYRIALSSPDRASALTTQASYFAHSFRGANVSADETMRMLLFGDLAIGKGKYGAGLGRILTDLADPSKSKFAGQVALGIRSAQGALIPGIAVDSAGNFTPTKMIEYLARREENRKGIDRQGDLAKAFEITSARTLSNMTSSQSLSFFKSFSSSLNRMPSLEVAQGQLLNTLNGETTRLTQNFRTLSSIIGDRFVSPLTGMAKSTADAEGAASRFLFNHPTAAAALGLGLGGAGIYGAARLLGLGHGALVGLSHLGGRGARIGGDFLEGVTGLMKRGAGAALNFASMPELRGMIGGGLSRVTAPARGMIGADFERLVKPGMDAVFKMAGPLVEMVTRLGARAIPVVGEILLLIDAFKFAGAHAKDFGWVLGTTFKWIRTTGADLVKDAFMGIVHWLADTLGGIWNVATHPWLIGDWAKTVGAAAAAANADHVMNAVHRAAAHGHDGRVGGTQVIHHVDIHVSGAGDPKKTAEAVKTALLGIMPHPQTLKAYGKTRTAAFVSTGDSLSTFAWR